MKNSGCLLAVGIAFICILSLYAANVAVDEDRLRTPDYYEVNVRALFKQGRWEEGKTLLDQGLEKFPDVTGLNELNGQYYYEHKNYDDARYYLVLSVRDNPDNVRAKQLLVKVEEETKNYSSAICYVNELLEINPFWRGLWRKKIGLYRLQGNDVEADRLLKRLHQIYPNDSVVTRDYANGLEEAYIRHRKAGDRDDAIASLRELITARPDNESYYLDLTNLLLQQGNTTEALEIVGRGCSRLPGSAVLIVKKAGILAGEGRYPEALSFVKERMRFNRSAYLQRFYNGLMEEAAAAAALSDPYVLYGKVYENTGSDEALDYMLNNSILRRYDEDALYYLAEAKKKRGETPALLAKEYTVYKQMGNTGRAFTALNTLYEMNPADSALADELALIRLQQANQLMADGFYADALPSLEFAAKRACDPEVKAAAWNKVYACQYELRHYYDALASLDSLHSVYPEYHGYLVKAADVYSKTGERDIALDMLHTAMQDTTQREMHAAYAGSYEEIAVPYIKELIEKGASRKALEESSRLLEVNPSSMEGLQYAINMSALLDRYDEYDHYTAQARSIYPEEIGFIVKQASAYNREKEYQRAIDLVRPQLEDYPHNAGLVGAFSENSERMTYQLLKEHEPEEALAVIDTALVFDRNNPSLLLAKGTVYESLKEFDSAYVYQRQYKPAIGEVKSHQRHLEGLQSRAYKNEVSLEYLQSRYGEEDIITSVATASYSRKLKRDVITGRINYAGRDGSAAGEDPADQVPGGQGIQLQAEWEHEFSRRWSMQLNAAWGSRYFPQYHASAQVKHTFKRDVELDAHASYRRIRTYSKVFAFEQLEGTTEGFWMFDHWNESRHDLFSAGVGAYKNWERVRLGGKLDGFLLSDKFYVNASMQAKFFPGVDGRTSVQAVGSVGTAPEANMIDYALPGTFSRLNSMVGLGGSYMINKHFTIGLMGTWNTFYSQVNQREGSYINDYRDYMETRFKNLFNVHVQLQIHF